jgi:hypothetical protein
MNECMRLTTDGSSRDQSVIKWTEPDPLILSGSVTLDARRRRMELENYISGNDLAFEADEAWGL